MFFDGLNSRLNTAEERIRCLKTGQYKLSKLKYKQEKKKEQKVWNRVPKNRDKMKCSNICVIGVSDKEGRENQQQQKSI